MGELIYDESGSRRKTDAAIIQADISFDNERVTRSYEFQVVK
ncbi:hypothetical protein [Niallia taxi]